MKSGATSISRYYVLRDATTTERKTDVVITDIDLYYIKYRQPISDKIDLQELSGPDAPFQAGYGCHVGNGEYRIDWPDDAFSGEPEELVELQILCDTIIAVFEEITLTGSAEQAQPLIPSVNNLRYIEYSDAQDYFDYVMNTTDWDNAIPTEKTKALTVATKAIDQLRFAGSKTDSAQVLQFPRGGDTVVPQDILEACCDIALELLKGTDVDEEFNQLFMNSFKYGQVGASYDRKVVPEHILVGIPSSKAWSKLRPYILDPGEITLNRV